jgi:multidrug efflux system membrane fusion protein
MQHKHLFLLTGSFLAAVVSGCKWEASRQVAPSEAPAIPISHPVQREVTDYVDFTGRTDAVQAVDVRPRVTGYIIDMPFEEGAEVKAGKLLFKIDPGPYKAQLAQAKSQVLLNEAALEVARTTYERDRHINATQAGSVSQQQLAEERGAVQMADARLKASQASRDLYQLNLDYTEVVAPISGQVSRYYYTRGNLVNADQTVLTSIVSLDPMYVYFDLDEPTLIRIRKALNEGKLEQTREGKTPVLMGLQGEDSYPQEGFINFINNQVSSSTGSITMRGVFDNPRPSNGERLLSPGMFVRVRLPIGQPHKAFLVIDRAIASDQGIKYVYVVDDDNKVQSRRVSIGALQSDGLRVITEGLKADDWVVVGGLPQIRPRMVIRPDRTTMPTLAPSSTPETPADKDGKQAPPPGNKPKP